MSKNMYSVYDEKAKAFSFEFFRPHHGVAIRYFQDACKNEETMFHKHPEDYSLWFHGGFDDEEGELVAVAKVRLCGADECLTDKGGNSEIGNS